MKTLFQFRTKLFNTREPRDYFINPGCFGDDTAAWLIGRLADVGIEATSMPDQEDFGWFFHFMVDGVEHSVVIGFQPNDAEKGDCWIGWIERNVSFPISLLGGRKRGISPKALEIVDKILTAEPEIFELSWSIDK